MQSLLKRFNVWMFPHGDILECKTSVKGEHLLNNTFVHVKTIFQNWRLLHHFINNIEYHSGLILYYCRILYFWDLISKLGRSGVNFFHGLVKWCLQLNLLCPELSRLRSRLGFIKRRKILFICLDIKRESDRKIKVRLQKLERQSRTHFRIGKHGGIG